MTRVGTEGFLSGDVKVVQFVAGEDATVAVAETAAGTAEVTIGSSGDLTGPAVAIGEVGGTIDVFGSGAAVRQNIGATATAANITAALIAAGWLTNIIPVTTGTSISGGCLESEVVTGGLTIIITLTGAEWAATTPFNAARQAIIDGLTAVEEEAAGWNATVKTTMVVANVVRTSATICTITLPAVAGYSITVDENVVITVPIAAVVGLYEPTVSLPNVVVTANS